MRHLNVILYLIDLGFHLAILLMMPLDSFSPEISEMFPYEFDGTVVDLIILSFLRVMFATRKLVRTNEPGTRVLSSLLASSVVLSSMKLVFRLLDFRRGSTIQVDDFLVISFFGFVISSCELVLLRIDFRSNQSTLTDAPLTWQRLFRFADGHWTRLSVGVCVLLCRLPFSLAVPHFVSEAIGALLKQDQDLFFNACMYLVISGTVDAVLDFWCVYIFATAQQEIVYEMRKMLFESLIDHPQSFFDTSSIGEIQSRLNTDTAEMANNLSWVFRFAIEAVIRVAGILIYMFVCSWRLALLVVVMIPITAFANTYFSQWMSDYAKQGQDTLASANSIAQESFGAIQTVKSFSGETKTKLKYKHALIEYKNLQYKAAIVSSTFYMLVSTFLINTIGQASIIGYGGLLALHGMIATERLVSFLLYRGSLQYYFSSLMETWVNLMKCAKISDRVFELLSNVDDEDRSVVRNGRGGGSYRESSQPPPEIRFEKISHRYKLRPEIEVLSNVSFVAKPGQCCAIVGPSGSGKSSLVSLLLRLYTPTAGSIFIDETNVGSVPVDKIRGRICCVVSQEPVLFRGTIRDNVLYGLSDDQIKHLSESTINEMVNRALSIACISEFIDSLPQKKFTQIGDRGVTLSGGQKQRIAIARAMITNPPVLLLDEAMSALDPESEVAVQRALCSAMKSRTTIMVSHRISSVIEIADYVVVLHKGVIVEQGNPRTLLQQEGSKETQMSLRVLYQSQQASIYN